MKLILQQQICGRVPGEGFVTIAASPELGKPLVSLMEELSKYSQVSEAAPTISPSPHRLFCCRPSSGKMCLGQGVYLGADEFGREGNRLFHNLFIDVTSLETTLANPVRLLRFLSKSGLFAEYASEVKNPLSALELDFSSEGHNTPSLLMEDDRIREIVCTVFFNQTPLPAPMVFLGPTDLALAILEDLYDILPPDSRYNLSFSTNWNEDDAVLPGSFIGVLNAHTTPSRYSLLVDIENRSVKTGQIGSIKKHRLSQLISQLWKENPSALSKLYAYGVGRKTSSLQEANPVSRNKEIAPEILLLLYRNKVLLSIKEGNVEFYQIVAPHLTGTETAEIFQSPAFLQKVLSLREQEICNRIVAWWTEELGKKTDIRTIQVAHWILDLLLRKESDTSQERHADLTEFLEGLFRLFASNPELDETIQEQVYRRLVKTQALTFVDSKRVLKALRVVPMPSNFDLLFLRSLVLYRLDDPDELICIIKTNKFKSQFLSVLKPLAILGDQA